MILNLFLSQKLRKLFLLMKIMDRLAMHIKLHLRLPPNYVSGTYLVDAHNGVMLKNTLQESDLKVSEEQVESLKENKKAIPYH